MMVGTKECELVYLAALEGAVDADRALILLAELMNLDDLVESTNSALTSQSLDDCGARRGCYYRILLLPVFPLALAATELVALRLRVENFLAEFALSLREFLVAEHLDSLRPAAEPV